MGLFKWHREGKAVLAWFYCLFYFALLGHWEELGWLNEPFHFLPWLAKIAGNIGILTGLFYFIWQWQNSRQQRTLSENWTQDLLTGSLTLYLWGTMLSLYRNREIPNFQTRDRKDNFKKGKMVFLSRWQTLHLYLFQNRLMTAIYAKADSTHIFENNNTKAC